MNLKTTLTYSMYFIMALSCSAFAQSEKELADEIEGQRTIWNNALLHDTTMRFKKTPNTLLVQTVTGKRPGDALDIGMGQGRNSIFLAGQGWNVTGFDVADEAVAAAVNNATSLGLVIDARISSMQQFDFGIGKWDLIVHVYEGCLDGDNGKFQKITNALRPGGLLVFEFFHRNAGAKLGMENFGCTSGSSRELVERSGQYKLLFYSEEEAIADFTLKKLKVIKLVAERLR